jgi:biotin synthase
MSLVKTDAILKRVSNSRSPELEDLIYLLSLEDSKFTGRLFDFADRVRQQYTGDGVVLRGIIEFSNYCHNNCIYCGLNCDNKNLPRYRMTEEQILETADRLVDSAIRTIVLQSGEDPELAPDWLSDIIRKLKTKYDIAVTLSVGELPREYYQQFKQAGADRYLLKIETTDSELYKALHPGMSIENRLRCLRDLEELGYQTGSGNIVGLPGQTIESIAKDILFFKAADLDMIGLGPFIPDEGTQLSAASPGDVNLALKTLAVTRIVTRNTHIPASTAFGFLGDTDNRPKALGCGANVIMPNFTPPDFRKLYKIYPKNENFVEIDEVLEPFKLIIRRTGRKVDYSRADTLKKEKNGKIASAVLN